MISTSTATACRASAPKWCAGRPGCSSPGGPPTSPWPSTRWRPTASVTGVGRDGCAAGSRPRPLCARCATAGASTGPWWAGRCRRSTTSSGEDCGWPTSCAISSRCGRRPTGPSSASTWRWPEPGRAPGASPGPGVTSAQAIRARRQPMDGDVVIRGGTVVDGTGAPGRRADVAVRDGRISAVGENLTGGREIDAGGQVVAPGFVDIHTHYDAQVFWDPWLTPSCHHGVTTVVAGNCGFSIAPVRPDDVGLLARTLQHVEDMSFDTLSVGVPWAEFETFPQYLDAVERRGAALNYGCYVGHTAVRLFVMGEESYERPATEEEVRRMQA